MAVSKPEKGRKVDWGQLAWGLVVVLPALLLLLRPDSGFRLLFKSEQGFTATPSAWWGSAAGLVLGLLLLLGAYLASEALKQEHAAYLAKKAEDALTPQQKRVKEYLSREYEVVRELEFPALVKPKAGGGAVAAVKATLVAMDEDQDNSQSMWTRRGGIAYEDGRYTDFIVTVLFDKMSWRKRDNLNLESELNGKELQVAEALSTSSVRRTAEDAKYVVCFGLASNEEGSNSTVNEELAIQRAFHLCRAVKNLDLMKRPSAKAIGVALGAASHSTRDDQIAMRQRSAVVVAITETFLDLRASDIAIAASNLIKVQNVNLTQYEYFDGGYTIMADVQKGPYVVTGARSGAPAKLEDDIIIRASPMAERPQ